MARRLSCVALAAVVLGSAPSAWAGATQLVPPSPPPTPPPPPGCGQDAERCCSTGSGGKRVDFWNGREFLTHTDLELPGLMPIVVKRSYDSQAQYDSALGYGWALNYFMRLYEFGDGSVIFRRDCGVRRSFLLVAGAYQTPVGETGTLVKNADGSWTYTEKSGEQKRFDAQGRLTFLVSPQGPYLGFTYDARGKLPLIGLSPYAVDTTPKEIAREHRLLRIDEFATGGTPTGRYATFTYDEATGRLTTLADSAGRSISYQHDGNGNLTQVSLPEGGVLNYAYLDPKDPHNATDLTYSGCTACGGFAYQLTYDAQDRVYREQMGTNVLRITYDQAYVKTIVHEDVTDAQGNPLYTATSTYEFNSLGNPTKVTDALGHQKVFVYDGNMNLTREERWENVSGTLTLRYVEERSYDSRGNLQTKTEAKGTPQERVTTYIFDGNNHLTSISVPSVVNPAQSKLTSFTYYPQGNLWTQTETGLLASGAGYSHTTTYTYDGNGRLQTIDGPRTDVTDVTTFAYDPVTGNLTSVTQPGSLTTSYGSYTLSGQPQTVTDPNGVVTSFIYDTLGRVKTATLAGFTTTYGYTPTGKLGSITLPRTNATTYTYDTLDRLVTIQDGLGNSVSYTYDSAGNRLKEEIKDPVGVLQKTLSFQNDTLKRLFRVVNPDNSFTEYGYDYGGNRSSVKDPNLNTTTYGYDGLSRLISTTQPGSAITSYGYNPHDDLLTVTDAENHLTSYVYDDLGRAAQEISPDPGTTSYTYDPAGNRTSKTDARGVTVSYTYDANNRVTRIDFPTDTDVVYTYDTCTNGKGRLCQVQDQAGTTSYAYNTRGQLSSETRVVLGISYVTSYGYDANGNLATVTYPSGRTASYTYDLADRVTSVTTTPLGGAAQTVATGIAHKPFGGISGLTYGNGLARSVGYDQQYRITSIQTSGVQGLTYGHDFNGNITGITNTLNPAQNKGFGYDALDRLRSATGPWGSLGWTYDKLGNRLTQTAPEGASSYAYTTGTSRLASVSGPSPLTFGYDANGNITTENAKSYTYNQNNRMTQAVTASASYTHNAQEQRVTKTVGTQITVFHHDQQGNILAETLPSGATVAEYIHLEGQPIAKAEAGQTYFIQTDHLGTPVAMANSAGAKVWEIEPRPFGDGATITGTATLNLRFPGQYADQETGLNQNWHREYMPYLGRYSQTDPIGPNAALNLHYYRARYYDPKIGRFISEDPIGFNSGDGANFFAYVANNPISRIDPLGLASCREECLREAQEIYRKCRANAKDAYDEEVDRINRRCSGLARLMIPGCWQWKPGNYWEVAKGNYYAELSRCRRQRLDNEATCKRLPPCDSRDGGC